MAAIALHDVAIGRMPVDDVVDGLQAAVDELHRVDLDALDEAGLGRLLSAGETTLRRIQGCRPRWHRP